MSNVTMLLLLMMMLTANARAADDKLFKRQGNLQPNQAIVATSEPQHSKLQCAIDCLEIGDQCIAFAYSSLTAKCQLMSCLNMDALTEEKGDIYTDVSINSTHLLAQGKFC